MLKRDAKITPNVSAWLKAIRGLAALAVVKSHLNSLAYPRGHYAVTDGALAYAYQVAVSAAHQGHMAVLMFFALSGYLAGGTTVVKVVTGQQHLREYLISRFARIYTVLIPALILTFAAVSFALWDQGGDGFFDRRPGFYPEIYEVADSLTLGTAVCNLAFLQMMACWQYGGNLSLWSLSNEGLYYLTFAAALLATRSRAWLIGVCVLLLVMISSAFIGPLAHPTRPAWYVGYFMVWLWGAGMFAMDKRQLPWPLLGGLVLTLLMVLSTGTPYSKPTLSSDLTVGVLCALILACIEKADLSPGILRHRAFDRLSRMSFSIYATHIPIIIAMLVGFNVRFKGGSWLALRKELAIMIAVVAFAWCFYWLTERNTPIIRRWLLSLIDARPPAPPSAAQGPGPQVEHGPERKNRPLLWRPWRTAGLSVRDGAGFRATS